jgi:hypothetical protein
MIEAMKHYEAALLEAFPRGATGDVFEHWNKARQAIEQAEKQEPVAHIDHRIHAWPDCIVQTAEPPHTSPLYNTPQPQREWVGLSEDDRNEILIDAAKHNWDDRLILKQMEAKLKERNGGNT